MKKVLLIFLFLASVFANQSNVEKRIYETILNALFPAKQTICIWVDEPSKVELFKSINGVKVVSNSSKADILMLFKGEDIHKIDDSKKIFANGYLVFQRVKGEAIGGFYWQKGRPNLVFINKKLKESGVSLPKKLKKYIENID